MCGRPIYPGCNAIAGQPVSFPLNGGTLQAETNNALPAMAASASRFDRIG
jgi:hypothetical protein